jgi:hypothetical protein
VAAPRRLDEATDRAHEAAAIPKDAQLAVNELSDLMTASLSLFAPIDQADMSQRPARGV